MSERASAREGGQEQMSDRASAREGGQEGGRDGGEHARERAPAYQRRHSHGARRVETTEHTHHPVVRQSINQPFIVLTETKFSYRYIPVWARYSPHRTRVEAHANMLSP